MNLSKSSSSSSSSSSSNSASNSKSSLNSTSKNKGGGANIVDNGDEVFEKIYESTFINSNAYDTSLSSAYKDFDEYEKMKTLGLGDTDEAKQLKSKIVESYINSQIDKTSEDEVPDALKIMIREYYENIGDN